MAKEVKGPVQRVKEQEAINQSNMKTDKIKSDLRSVIKFVKQRMDFEKDENVKKAWAEVGLKLNEIYLHNQWIKK